MAQLVDLAAWLDTLPGQLEAQQAELQAAAQAQVDRIKTRTATGISVDLQIFPPYSPATRKNPPVNLRETGEMVDSIVAVSTNDEAHIRFENSDAETKARYHNEGTRSIPQRYFFGVSLQDREEIIADIRAALFRRINK
jgi:hypothetical protein